MSLYFEAAAALAAPAEDGGNLKTRIFGHKSGNKGRDDHRNNNNNNNNNGATKKEAFKAQPAQVYALAVETCKWSRVLSEVVDASGMLTAERVRFASSSSPATLALLLTYDFLLTKEGIRLKATHTLREAVTRHRTRLRAELTRAWLRRGLRSLEALREHVEAEAASSRDDDVRWIRINTLRTTLEEQLQTTFSGYEKTDDLSAVSSVRQNHIYIDQHVPDLVAVPQAATAALTKGDAYQTGAVIFQDKASCFPAYLLDPASLDGDLVDACAAPGNKTSHMAALASQGQKQKQKQSESQSPSPSQNNPKIFAFEKDKLRARTLQSMLQRAGALGNDSSSVAVTVAAGQDFLQVDPHSAVYRHVRGLLLDPSCSGSGIVGRDAMPTLHLPRDPGAGSGTRTAGSARGTKRKRGKEGKDDSQDQDIKKDNKKDIKKDNKKDIKKDNQKDNQKDIKKDDNENQNETDNSNSDNDRIAALATFQTTLLRHALRFPSARRVTYSTCSVHAQENEGVVLAALASEEGRHSKWRLLRRDEQVEGMQTWPVRGDAAATEKLMVERGRMDDNTKEAAAAIADACIRSYPGDGRGVMGFFVAAFVREEGAKEEKEEEGEAEGEEENEEEKEEENEEENEEEADEWGGFDD